MRLDAIVNSLTKASIPVPGVVSTRSHLETCFGVRGFRVYSGTERFHCLVPSDAPKARAALHTGVRPEAEAKEVRL